MAEFLIKARDPIDLPSDPEKRDRCYRRGDFVVVMPDGHEWGKEERLPKFVVVKIPGLPVETARKYVGPYYQDIGIVDPDGQPIRKLVQKSKFRVLLNNVPANLRNQLTTTGMISVPWETVKSYVYNKLTMQTE